MGIDLLDISFRIEKSFSIRLSRDDFLKHDADGRVRGPTAGELLEAVCRRLSERLPAGPAQRPLLHARVVRLLADFSGAGIALADETQPLADLISPEYRVQAWRVLERELNVRLPRLRRAPYINALIAGGLVWGALSLLAGCLLYGPSATVYAVATAGLTFSGRTWAATTHARVHFSRHCQTLRTLVDHVLSESYPACAPNCGHWHENDVWIVLQQVLVDTLGVRPEEVTREARLVEDMGAN